MPADKGRYTRCGAASDVLSKKSADDEIVNGLFSQV